MNLLFVAFGLVLASTQFSQSIAADSADLSKSEAQPGSPVVGETQPDALAVMESALMRTPAVTLREHVIDAFDFYEDGIPLPDCLGILTKCDFSNDNIDEVYLERMEAAVLAMNLDAPQFALQLLEFNILSPLVPLTQRVLSLTLAHCSGYADKTWMVKKLSTVNEFVMNHISERMTFPIDPIMSLVTLNCTWEQKIEDKEREKTLTGEQLWKTFWQGLAVEDRNREWASFVYNCQGVSITIPFTEDFDTMLSQSLIFCPTWLRHITSHSNKNIMTAYELRLSPQERIARQRAREEIEASFTHLNIPLGSIGSIDSNLN